MRREQVSGGAVAALRRWWRRHMAEEKADTTPKTVTLDAVMFWRTRAEFAEALAEMAQHHQALQQARARHERLIGTFCAAHGFDSARPVVFDEKTLEVRQAAAAATKKEPPK